MQVWVLMRIPSCIDLLPCHLFVSHVLIFFFLYVYILNKWFLISDFWFLISDFCNNILGSKFNQNISFRIHIPCQQDKTLILFVTRLTRIHFNHILPVMCLMEYKSFLSGDYLMKHIWKIISVSTSPPLPLHHGMLMTSCGPNFIQPTQWQQKEI